MGVGLLLVLVSAAPARAATFTVNSNGSQADAAPGDTVCATAGGACTLRAAIQEANALAGADTINFNIGGGGLRTITPNPLALLPAITQPVTINGNTQPGYAGTPLIQLNGANVPGADGLVLNAGASGSTIRALAINRFGGGRAAIRIQGGSSGNRVVGCHLGTNPAGTAPLPNGFGLIIDDSSGNTIGGTGVAPPDRNVISGNEVDGIQIYGPVSDNNLVRGNHIGVDLAGTAPLGNAGEGVAIFSRADDTVVGGIAPGQGNVISGNGNNGVLISDALTTGHVLQGNRIGTNAAGTAAIPNLRGVVITTGASGNTIGGPLGSQNVISGNTMQGVLVDDGDNNTVSRAHIGTDLLGTSPIPNGEHGVELVNGASGNTIGADSGNGNVISGNGWSGVNIRGGTTTGNLVRGNLIGLASGGDAILGNGQFGVAIAQGANGNTIGDPAGGNVVSGNALAGVRIVDVGTSNNLVQSNFIGVDEPGMQARPNLAEGVILDTAGVATGNRIGGVGFGNLISGNGGPGVRILNGMTGTLVVANAIGVDAALSGPVPNGGGGVLIEGASGNAIGGTGAGEGNVIHTNDAGGGVAVTGAGTGNSILRNSIVGNAGLGIDLGNDGVTSNDLGDGDAGPNALQNFPLLSAAMTNGAGSANIAGSLHGVAGVTYRIELFASPAVDVDPTGFGEGRRYLGATNVTANVFGDVVIGGTLSAALTAGELVTATATVCTDGAPCGTFGDTSEFSAPTLAYGSLIVTTTADTADGTTTSVSALIANPGADGRISLREAILATNNTPGTDTVRFGIPLTDANHLYYQDDAIGGGSLTVVQATTLADTASPSAPAIPGFDTDYPAGLTRSWYRIQPGAAYPAITGGITLDGTTQPGSLAGGPVIEVVGNSAGVDTLNLQAGSSGSTVRGFVMRGAPGHAIRLRSSNNVVAGNYFGTNVAGTAPGPGNWTGVRIGDPALAANDNRIGGLVPADRNVISGNFVDGIQISGGTGGAANNLVQGNYIGLDVTGTLDLGNSIQGVALFLTSTTNTVIGGTAPGAGNVISGNGGDGIGIEGAGTTGTLVQGNRIGTNEAGTAGIPNNNSGVRIETSASNNTVGGTAASAGNLIAHNNPGNTVGRGGVEVRATAGTGNSILGNAIHSNGGLGIDLNQDGVTPNDINVNDADAGPNGLLNFPVFASPVATAGTLSFNYVLDLAPGFYRIEFFRNPTVGADPSGYGEGEASADAVIVDHPGGRVPYPHSFAGSAGEVITATTTECVDGAPCMDPGSTSEFGLAVSAVTTAVELMSFTATGIDRAVELEWRTGSELNNLGFHLHRSLSETGPWQRITASLIPGLGSSPMGATYTWRDVGLVNGTRYFYRLEDVDTASLSTFHGPVSAVPQAGAGEEDGSGDGDGDSGSDESNGSGESEDGFGEGDSNPSASSASLPECTSPPFSRPCVVRYGDPSSVSTRVVKRTRRFAVLELETGGFEAVHEPDGRVWVRVPGFEEEVGDPHAPALPFKRLVFGAPVGKTARVSWVRERGVESYPGLVPSAVGFREMDIRPDGTVRAGRRRASLRDPRGSVVPRRLVHLGEPVFFGERKGLSLELYPVRYDASRGGVRLSRRLRVRVEFAGRAASESGKGTRGRRVPRRRPGDGETLAFLHTTKRGLHGVSFETLFPGRSRGLSLDLLKLQRQGEAVPYHVEPSGTRFGPGSVLYFWAEGGPESTSYSGEVGYELVRASGGKRMVRVSASPHGDVLTTPSLGPTFEETNRIYQSGLLEAEDLWLWENLVGGVEKTKSFELGGVDPSSLDPGRVRVFLQGGSDAEGVVDHRVEVLLNGAFVGETVFDGKASHSVELEVAAALLREGPNDLTVRNVGDTGVYSLVFLDRFSVEYPQTSALRGGVFEGRWSQAGIAQVAGSSSLSAVDVTDAGNPLWLGGLEAWPGSVRLRVEAERSYLLVSPAGVLTPRVSAPVASSLKNASHQADYIVITPQAFLPAAQTLAQRREGQGLRTKVATLEEIASAFGHGEASGEAIRAFLTHAYHEWRRPSPRYVVLLGDASHDPRNFIGTSAPAPLPALFLKTSYLVTASDPALVAVNGEDLLPDLAIGRLPAQTVEQAQSLITKILAWEDSGQGLGGTAVLVADNPDEAGDFEADVQDIADSYLTTRSTQTILLRQEGANTRSRILQAMDEGASLVSYAGHGGAAVWASENVLNSWDVGSLQAQSTQGVMLTLNCLNGYFVAPAFDSLGEAYLKAEGRGTVGAFSPSGLSLDGPAHQFHRALMRELTGGAHERLGDAVLAAQESYAGSGLMPELLSIYHLLGDPGLRIR